MTADGCRADDERSGRAEFWARSMRGWDLTFYGMIAVCSASIVVQGSSASTRVVSVTALAVLVAGYTVIGRRAAWRGDERGAYVYLVVLVATTVTVVRAEGLGSLLLFIAFSHIWFFAARRSQGIAFAVVLTVGSAAAMALRVRADGGEVLEIAGQMTVALAFSMLLGLWITQVAEQSEERADLIDRLEDAQAALAETNHAAGVLAERERFAQEIHDTLAQGFTSVVMLAQATIADLDRGGTGPARVRLAQIEDVARENLAEARALVAAYGPVGLEDSGLHDALTRLGARFSAETGVDVEVDPGHRTPLPRDTEVVVLRAAQEALANVRKHAGARSVRLAMSIEDGSVRLEIVDDGRGLPPDVAEGVGLRGMRDRVRSVGGTLDVGDAAHGGTLVRLRLPDGTTERDTA